MRDGTKFHDVLVQVTKRLLLDKESANSVKRYHAIIKQFMEIDPEGDLVHLANPELKIADEKAWAINFDKVTGRVRCPEVIEMEKWFKFHREAHTEELLELVRFLAVMRKPKK